VVVDAGEDPCAVDQLSATACFTLRSENLPANLLRLTSLETLHIERCEFLQELLAMSTMTRMSHI